MAIPYQLPNGKTVFFTWEQWDSLTDEDIQNLMAEDAGYYIDDPFDPAYDHMGDPKVFNVPDVFSEDNHIPEDELNKIKKDFEDSI